MDERFAPLQLMRTQAKALWQGAVDLVVPARCLACGVEVAGPSSLCVGCWRQVEFIEAPVCDVLGIPLPYDQGEGAVSAAAIQRRPAWRKMRAAVGYGDVSGQLVQAFKYHDRFEAGHFMARLLRLAAAELIAEADYIIPVPLYRWRLWGRRFNQSAFLAQQLARAYPKRFRSDVLQRHRATSPQVGLVAAQRQKNVQGAFSVPGVARAMIAGRTVLLVDDVMTTGATVSTCAETLLAAGAGQIYVATFALVLERYRAHISG